MMLSCAKTLAWMVVAVSAAATPAIALHAQDASQRLSLADRVTRLEHQAQADGGSLGLVNQVQVLRSQIQQMQGQIEQLQHDLQQAQQQNKDQYIDLDSRLGRLEGRPPGASNPAAASSSQGPVQLQDVPLGDSAPPVVAPAPPPVAATDAANASAASDPQADYDRAFSSLRNGDFAAASRRFSSFIKSHPQSDLMPNAYYWLGESYYGTQNYAVALRTFNELLQRYPTSSKAKDALLKVGYCQFEMQQWSAAQATLRSVIDKYPGTSDARLAEGRLRALALQTRQ
ncbi:MAG: tol-pal system protein YbgF [Xanthomonadales bacterium]|nr:tol-pal system protein YbgF [Xanthomonadales bacterium]